VSGEYGGCGTKVILSLARNICTDKQSGQEHCCSVETNLRCNTSQIVLTKHLPVDTVEFLCGNAGLQCVPMDQMHGTQFHVFQTKQWACNLYWNENVCSSLAMEMIGFAIDILSLWGFSIDILSLCFFSIAKFSVIVLLILKQNVMHLCYSIMSVIFYSSGNHREHSRHSHLMRHYFAVGHVRSLK